MTERDYAEFVSFDAQFRTNAGAAPRALALTDGSRSLSYAQLDAEVGGAAAALARAGVRGGDVVGLAGANSIDYLVCYLALLRLGAGAALLPISADPDALAAMVANSGASIIAADAEAAHLIDPASPRAPAVLHLADVANGNAGETIGNPGIDPDATFNIIYSSGTTGTPKGIVHTHAMRWRQLREMSALGYGAHSVCIASTPLYSNTTLVGLLPALLFGGAVVLMRRFDTGHFLQLCEEFRVTHAMLVPTQIRRILSDPGFATADLSSFQLKISTSAPLSAELKREALARWPGGLVEFYGMTEGGGTCVLVAHAFPDKLHTVGRPAPGHDIRVIDEDGNELPPGSVGEVVGRSGVTMSGYRDAPDKSADALWHAADGKPFLRTGDIGRFDEDGFLILIDRRKDMIISGGFNLYPSDIESVLLRHPQILEAAVVGVPSERWGETPVAFIVARPEVNCDPGAVVEWANPKLGRNQRIARAVMLAELPRSPIGKVLKRTLRDRFAAEFGTLS